MWKAPLALLSQHESMHPPPVPPGGWVAAVTAAAAPLELLMTTKDILEARDGPEASLATGVYVYSVRVDWQSDVGMCTLSSPFLSLQG